MWCSEIYDRDLTSAGRIHDAMTQRGGGGGGRGSRAPSPPEKPILIRIPEKLKSPVFVANSVDPH